MSCPGKPIHTETDPGCQFYNCDNDECVKMKFIYARHWFKHGQVIRGAAGAYLPAVTVCQLRIETIPIGDVGKNPNYPYIGLKE